jgi:hypothetical protein
MLIKKRLKSAVYQATENLLNEDTEQNRNALDDVVRMLRETDAVFANDNGNRRKNRKTIKHDLNIKTIPIFVSSELSEYVSRNVVEIKNLGHLNVDVIWDDGCCCAIYCEDCKRWGHFTYDYTTLDGYTWGNGGPEFSGELFGARCSDEYIPNLAKTIASVFTGRRMDEQSTK